MFSNIGGKIKGLALAVTVLGIVGSSLAGIGSMAINPVVGIITIVIGAVASWLGSLVLYGMGQLIENSDEIVEYLEAISQTNVSIFNIINNEIKKNKTEK